MKNLIASLGIIFAGLFLGYTIQILSRYPSVSSPIEIEAFRKTIQKIAILFIDPIIYIGAIWDVNLDNIKYVAMPFLGLMSLVLGGILAFFIAKLLKMSRKQNGSFIISGSFTNIGSIGSLLCYSFLGEAGFAGASIYKLFETLAYYSIGFPIAKYYSDDLVEVKRFREHAKKTISDPFVMVAIGSMFVGFALNVSGFVRPRFYSNVNALLIPISSILLLSSIGMALHIGRARKFVFEGLLIALIKFVIVPATMTTIGYLIGFRNIDQGLPLKVVLILSSMPVGFTAMVATMIYDLDVDLANSSWIITTTLLFLVVPLLYCMITLI